MLGSDLDASTQHLWDSNNDDRKGKFSQIPNELIFDKILCYFGYRWILQNARLVCKLWNDHHKIIKTNQFTITYNRNIEKICLIMNEHLDELHQVTELIIHIANNLNVRLERQFVSKLINLQYLELLSWDYGNSIIKEVAKLQNLKKVQLHTLSNFEIFKECPSRIKSITVSSSDYDVLDFSDLNWPLEEFICNCTLSSDSIMSLLKNEILMKNLNKLEIPRSNLDINVIKEISTFDIIREFNVSCEYIGAEYISKMENLEILHLNFVKNNNLKSGIGLSHLSNLRNITKLYLGRNCIDKEGANYLTCLTSLTVLDLQANDIFDEGLKNYCKLTNLSELYLNNNQIGSIGANYLSQITSLTFLDLNNNFIEEEGLKNFGNLSKLKTLHLHKNLIGKGFEYLANCKQLSTLKVSNNNISEESVMKYCEMKPLSITDFCVSFNINIGNSGFASLLKLQTLTSLTANGCGISDKGISKMLEILKTKTSKISLHLTYNNLTNNSLKKIIESKHIDKIESLIISKNKKQELNSKYANISNAKLTNIKVVQYNKVFTVIFVSTQYLIFSVTNSVDKQGQNSVLMENNLFLKASNI